MEKNKLRSKKVIKKVCRQKIHACAIIRTSAWLAMHLTIFVASVLKSSKGLAHRSFALGSIFEIMLRLKCSGIQVPFSRTPSILFSTLYFYFTLLCSILGLCQPMRYHLLRAMVAFKN